jgi:inosine-uridine nucleoside N-ribohydrolase
MRQKVILDVDTGGDDAVAILLAGHHPNLDLVAVCVTHGNGPLAVTLENTLRVVQVGELNQVPVFSGASGPLVGPVVTPMETQSALLPLPEATIQPQSRRAAEYLIDYYMSPDGLDTLYLPIGPQSNLALALRLEPQLAKRIPRIITMGGAYTEGNTTPSAEFNIYADPEAAHIVFSSGIPITMIGLEVTAQALVTLADTAHIANLGTPWAKAASLMMERDIQWFIDNLGWEGGQIFDACTVAAAVNPSIIKIQPMHVGIELLGALTRGRTVADITYHRNPPTVDVGVGINRQSFLQILEEGFS